MDLALQEGAAPRARHAGGRRTAWTAVAIAGLLLGAVITSAPAGAATHRRASTGYVTICASQSGSGLDGIVFNFSVGGRAFSAPVGSCTPAFAVQPGQVTVTEVARSGARFVSASTAPAGRLVSTDVPHGRATISVVAAPDESMQTIVTFENAAVPGTGFLKICNIAGPGVGVGDLYQFAVGHDSVAVTAGPARMGGYCVIVNAFPFSHQTILDEPTPHSRVTAIAVNPNPRLVARDLTRRQATVTIGSGTTTVTFTAARVS